MPTVTNNSLLDQLPPGYKLELRAIEKAAFESAVREAYEAGSKDQLDVRNGKYKPDSKEQVIDRITKKYIKDKEYEQPGANRLYGR